MRASVWAPIAYVKVRSAGREACNVGWGAMVGLGRSEVPLLDGEVIASTADPLLRQ
jgi:hypothetical protein